ncbi:hypothetical protein CAPTEDRAFT_210801 [Capitella teleta]|uniref:Uncharacterized protein n=1 Tax=Capitella teleta TaxID=283909 RepID=R7U1V2_CAPTE|nr:hypothetical protein CAPTEDRAFT_210801 [Capitella teleta]|eukprot:ELT99817.1 hypothetical protein CAPTEDRAFT_210801 [Capitella teleta]
MATFWQPTHGRRKRKPRQVRRLPVGNGNHSQEQVPNRGYSPPYTPLIPFSPIPRPETFEGKTKKHNREDFISSLPLPAQRPEVNDTDVRNVVRRYLRVSRGEIIDTFPSICACCDRINRFNLSRHPKSVHYNLPAIDPGLFQSMVDGDTTKRNSNPDVLTLENTLPALVTPSIGHRQPNWISKKVSSPMMPSESQQLMPLKNKTFLTDSKKPELFFASGEDGPFQTKVFNIVQMTCK